MIVFIFILFYLFQIDSPIARIHYKGGGDWYGNKTTFKNIFRLYESTFKVKLPLKEDVVELTNQKIYNYPILYISGHGNILFSEEEVVQLRMYLKNGGFLFVDDDFGLDKSMRREMKKVFPKTDFIELPFRHNIFQYPYIFSKGLPKIHEHSGGPAKAYGLYYKKRLVVFYSFNTDISDGCEDFSIHGDAEEVRLSAIKMGTNILSYGMNH